MGFDADKQRLQALVSGRYGYNFFVGYMIVIDVAQKPENAVCG